MVRYYIYLFTVIDNMVSCSCYNVRHFEVDNISLILYPKDYSDVIHIHLDPSIRFEVVPYRYLVEVHHKDETDSSN